MMIWKPHQRGFGRASGPVHGILARSSIVVIASGGNGVQISVYLLRLPVPRPVSVIVYW